MFRPLIGSSPHVEHSLPKTCQASLQKHFSRTAKRRADRTSCPSFIWLYSPQLIDPRGYKCPKFEASGSKSHGSKDFGDQKPRRLGSWTLCQRSTYHNAPAPLQQFPRLPRADGCGRSIRTAASGRLQALGSTFQLQHADVLGPGLTFETPGLEGLDRRLEILRVGSEICIGTLSLLMVFCWFPPRPHRRGICLDEFWEDRCCYRSC